MACEVPEHVVRPQRRRRRITVAVAVLAAIATVAVVMGIGWAATPGAGSAVYAPSLSGPDRLVTNEYAHWNPTDPQALRSPDWDVTSGSLLIHDRAGWTGVPDAAQPDRNSANGTGSSVFRVTTRRHDFDNVTVSLRLRVLGFVGDGRQAASETDGVHLFLRWKSPADLYVVSLNRRDGLLAVKRKSPGGPVNGGTYETLGQAPYPVSYNTWQSFTVRISTASANAVAIEVRQRGTVLLAVTDHGIGRSPITGAGAVGLRGDNCNFEFDNFRVVKNGRASD